MQLDFYLFLSVNVHLIRDKIKIHSMSIARTLGPPSTLGTMFLESRVVVRGEALVPVPRRARSNCGASNEFVSSSIPS